jgi:hypothetical protein
MSFRSLFLQSQRIAGKQPWIVPKLTTSTLHVSFSIRENLLRIKSNTEYFKEQPLTLDYEEPYGYTFPEKSLMSGTSKEPMDPIMMRGWLRCIKTLFFKPEQSEGLRGAPASCKKCVYNPDYNPEETVLLVDLDNAHLMTALEEKQIPYSEPAYYDSITYANKFQWVGINLPTRSALRVSGVGVRLKN